MAKSRMPGQSGQYSVLPYGNHSVQVIDNETARLVGVLIVDGERDEVGHTVLYALNDALEVLMNTDVARLYMQIGEIAFLHKALKKVRKAIALVEND